MAVKKENDLVKLVNEETGYAYVVSKKKSATKPMQFKKYDPISRKHVLFKEKKIRASNKK